MPKISKETDKALGMLITSLTNNLKSRMRGDILTVALRMVEKSYSETKFQLEKGKSDEKSN